MPTTIRKARAAEKKTEAEFNATKENISKFLDRARKLVEEAKKHTLELDGQVILESVEARIKALSSIDTPATVPPTPKIRKPLVGISTQAKVAPVLEPPETKEISAVEARTSALSTLTTHINAEQENLNKYLLRLEETIKLTSEKSNKKTTTISDPIIEEAEAKLKEIEEKLKETQAKLKEAEAKLKKAKEQANEILRKAIAQEEELTALKIPFNDDRTAVLNDLLLEAETLEPLSEDAELGNTMTRSDSIAKRIEITDRIESEIKKLNEELVEKEHLLDAKKAEQAEIINDSHQKLATLTQSCVTYLEGALKNLAERKEIKDTIERSTPGITLEPDRKYDAMGILEGAKKALACFSEIKRESPSTQTQIDEILEFIKVMRNNSSDEIRDVAQDIYNDLRLGDQPQPNIRTPEGIQKLEQGVDKLTRVMGRAILDGIKSSYNLAIAFASTALEETMQFLNQAKALKLDKDYKAIDDLKSQLTLLIGDNPEYEDPIYPSTKDYIEHAKQLDEITNQLYSKIIELKRNINAFEKDILKKAMTQVTNDAKAELKQMHQVDPYTGQLTEAKGNLIAATTQLTPAQKKELAEYLLTKKEPPNKDDPHIVAGKVFLESRDNIIKRAQTRANDAQIKTLQNYADARSAASSALRKTDELLEQAAALELPEDKLFYATIHELKDSLQSYLDSTPNSDIEEIASPERFTKELQQKTSNLTEILDELNKRIEEARAKEKAAEKEKAQEEEKEAEIELKQAKEKAAKLLEQAAAQAEELIRLEISSEELIGFGISFEENRQALHSIMEVAEPDPLGEEFKPGDILKRAAALKDQALAIKNKTSDLDTDLIKIESLIALKKEKQAEIIKRSHQKLKILTSTCVDYLESALKNLAERKEIKDTIIQSAPGIDLQQPAQRFNAMDILETTKKALACFSDEKPSTQTQIDEILAFVEATRHSNNEELRKVAQDIYDELDLEDKPSPSITTPKDIRTLEQGVTTLDRVMGRAIVDGIKPSHNLAMDFAKIALKEATQLLKQAKDLKLEDNKNYKMSVDLKDQIEQLIVIPELKTNPSAEDCMEYANQLDIITNQIYFNVNKLGRSLGALEKAIKKEADASLKKAINQVTSEAKVELKKMHQVDPYTGQLTEAKGNLIAATTQLTPAQKKELAEYLLTKKEPPNKDDPHIVAGKVFLESRDNIIKRAYDASEKALAAEQKAEAEFKEATEDTDLLLIEAFNLIGQAEPYHSSASITPLLAVVEANRKQLRSSLDTPVPDAKDAVAMQERAEKLSKLAKEINMQKIALHKSFAPLSDAIKLATAKKELEEAKAKHQTALLPAQAALKEAARLLAEAEDAGIPAKQKNYAKTNRLAVSLQTALTVDIAPLEKAASAEAIQKEVDKLYTITGSLLKKTTALTDTFEVLIKNSREKAQEKERQAEQKLGKVREAALIFNLKVKNFLLDNAPDLETFNITLDEEVENHWNLATVTEPDPLGDDPTPTAILKRTAELEQLIVSIEASEKKLTQEFDAFQLLFAAKKAEQEAEAKLKAATENIERLLKTSTILLESATSQLSEMKKISFSDFAKAPLDIVEKNIKLLRDSTSSNIPKLAETKDPEAIQARATALSQLAKQVTSQKEDLTSSTEALGELIELATAIYFAQEELKKATQILNDAKKCNLSISEPAFQQTSELKIALEKLLSTPVPSLKKDPSSLELQQHASELARISAEIGKKTKPLTGSFDALIEKTREQAQLIKQAAEEKLRKAKEQARTAIEAVRLFLADQSTKLNKFKIDFNPTMAAGLSGLADAKEPDPLIEDATPSAILARAKDLEQLIPPIETSTEELNRTLTALQSLVNAREAEKKAAAKLQEARKSVADLLRRADQLVDDAKEYQETDSVQTPLGIVQGNIQSLRASLDKPPPEETKDSEKIIARAAELSELAQQIHAQAEALEKNLPSLDDAIKLAAAKKALEEAKEKLSDAAYGVETLLRRAEQLIIDAEPLNWDESVSAQSSYLFIVKNELSTSMQDTHLLLTPLSTELKDDPTAIQFRAVALSQLAKQIEAAKRTVDETLDPLENAINFAAAKIKDAREAEKKAAAKLQEARESIVDLLRRADQLVDDAKEYQDTEPVQTPLGIVQGNIQSLRASLDKPSPEETKDPEKIIARATELSKLTQQIHDQARTLNTNLSPLEEAIKLAAAKKALKESEEKLKTAQEKAATALINATALLDAAQELMLTSASTYTITNNFKSSLEKYLKTPIPTLNDPSSVEQILTHTEKLNKISSELNQKITDLTGSFDALLKKTLETAKIAEKDAEERLAKAKKQAHQVAEQVKSFLTTKAEELRRLNISFNPNMSAKLKNVTEIKEPKPLSKDATSTEIQDRVAALYALTTPIEEETKTLSAELETLGALLAAKIAEEKAEAQLQIARESTEALLKQAVQLVADAKDYKDTDPVQTPLGIVQENIQSLRASLDTPLRGEAKNPREIQIRAGRISALAWEIHNKAEVLKKNLPPLEDAIKLTTAKKTLAENKAKLNAAIAKVENSLARAEQLIKQAKPLNEDKAVAVALPKVTDAKQALVASIEQAGKILIEELKDDPAAIQQKVDEISQLVSQIETQADILNTNFPPLEAAITFAIAKIESARIVEKAAEEKLRQIKAHALEVMNQSRQFLTSNGTILAKFGIVFDESKISTLNHLVKTKVPNPLMEGATPSAILDRANALEQLALPIEADAINLSQTLDDLRSLLTAKIMEEKAEVQLQTARESIANLLRRADQLVDDAKDYQDSDPVRTPLGIVQGNIQLLRASLDTLPPAETKDPGKIIERATKLSELTQQIDAQAGTLDASLPPLEKAIELAAAKKALAESEEQLNNAIANIENLLSDTEKLMDMAQSFISSNSTSYPIIREQFRSAYDLFSTLYFAFEEAKKIIASPLTGLEDGTALQERAAVLSRLATQINAEKSKLKEKNTALEKAMTEAVNVDYKFFVDRANEALVKASALLSQAEKLTPTHPDYKTTHDLVFALQRYLNEISMSRLSGNPLEYISQMQVINIQIHTQTKLLTDSFANLERAIALKASEPVTVKLTVIDGPGSRSESTAEFSDFDEVKDFITKSRDLLAEIRTLHTHHGHTKEYVRDYYNKVRDEIIPDLKAAQAYLKMISTSKETEPGEAKQPRAEIHELQENLEKLIKSAEAFDKQFREIQATLETPDAKDSAGKKALPSFAERTIVTKENLADLLRKIKEENGFAATAPLGTLTTAVEPTDLDHWSEIIDSKHAGVNVVEKLAVFVEETEPDSNEFHSTIADAKASLTLEGVLKLSFPETIILDDEKKEDFCYELANYLRSHGKLPTDPNAIQDFLNSPTYQEMDLSLDTEFLKKSLVSNYEVFTSKQAYIDEIYAVALAFVNSFLAITRDLTNKPLYINEPDSPEILRAIMTICELRNLRDPKNKIDYRNTSEFHIPKPTPEEAEILAARLDYIAKNPERCPDSPLLKQVNKLPFSLERSIPEEKKSPLKIRRAIPGSFTAEMEKVHKKAQEFKLKSTPPVPSTASSSPPPPPPGHDRKA